MASTQISGVKTSVVILSAAKNPPHFRSGAGNPRSFARLRMTVIGAEAEKIDRLWKEKKKWKELGVWKLVLLTSLGSRNGELGALRGRWWAVKRTAGCGA